MTRVAPGVSADLHGLTGNGDEHEEHEERGDEHEEHKGDNSQELQR